MSPSSSANITEKSPVTKLWSLHSKPSQLYEKKLLYLGKKNSSMALGSLRLGGNRSLMVRTRWGMMTRGETEEVLMVRAVNHSAPFT